MTEKVENNGPALQIVTNYEGGERNISVKVSDFTDTCFSRERLLLEAVRTLLVFIESDELRKSEVNEPLASVSESVEALKEALGW